MAAQSLVSVVIATHNMGRYLPVAVRSVLAQTYGNVEVLVIDDGSTDDTRQSIRPLLGDRRVKYRVQENAGQAAAKNRGIREARGEYVAFLDADDYWAPQKLDLQLPLFSRSDRIGVVYSRLFYIDEAGNQTGVSSNELFRGRVSGPLFIRNFIGFGTSVVRRECFERLGGFDDGIRMGIDYDLWLRLSTLYEFDYVDRPLLYYRKWSGQMSNDSTNRYLSGIRIMERFLREHPGLIEKDTVSEAWAHTYVGFGYCVRDATRRPGSGLSLFVRALRHKITYLPAWRAIAASVLRTQGGGLS